MEATDCQISSRLPYAADLLSAISYSDASLNLKRGVCCANVGGSNPELLRLSPARNTRSSELRTVCTSGEHCAAHHLENELLLSGLRVCTTPGHIPALLHLGFTGLCQAPVGVRTRAWMCLCIYQWWFTSLDTCQGCVECKQNVQVHSTCSCTRSISAPEVPDVTIQSSIALTYTIAQVRQFSQGVPASKGLQVSAAQSRWTSCQPPNGCSAMQCTSCYDTACHTSLRALSIWNS